MPVELPGRVMSAGGRAVHVLDHHGDGPTVLLLGGCGVPYYAWDAVVTLLADRRVVRMDRPGLVATPWPGRLPTLAEEIATLADVVDWLRSAPVIVAHSMGGLHAEGLVRSHPERVAALVLVDGSVSRGSVSPGDGEGWRRLATVADTILRVVPVTRPLGSLGDRLISSMQSNRLGLTSPRPAAQRAVYRRPDAVASVIAEQAAYDKQIADLAALRDEAGWPVLPVRVLTGGGTGGASWIEEQSRLAELLGGQQVVVDDSRHLMMLDRPDVIADAVRSLHL